MKVIYSGLEGSGKSLMLARVIRTLVKRNAKWAKLKDKKTGQLIGKERAICSNMHFSSAFEASASDQGVPIRYWHDIDELIKIRDADIIMDEVGNYFDARGWESLSLDARRWLTQGSKSGIEIYGSAQDFAQIDKSFRRLVNQLHDIRKLIGSPRPSATKPPVSKIWGLCAVNSLDPREYDEEEKSAARSLIPNGFFLIRRRDCQIFDTGERIERSKPPILRHEERSCEYHERNGGDGSCRFCKIVHY